MSNGIGTLAKDGGMGLLGKMYAHGISQGALTAAQGGKFQHGFFSAAFTAGFSPNMNGKSNFAKVVSSSIVGGTASVIGGGKFANGAITGAYVMLFNCMQHPESDVSSSNPKDEGMNALDWAQTGLDVVGLVPVFGEIADGLNALIYLARGDLLNAGLSAAAMVPVVGWGATGGKVVGKILRYTKDQQALVEIAKSVKKSGVTIDDAKILKEWAKKYDLPFRGPEIHPNRNFKDPHIHLGPIDHIPIK